MRKLKIALFSAVAALAAVVGMNAYSSIPLGGSIFPLTLISTMPINLTDAFNEMEMLVNQQTAAGTNGVLNINTASSVVTYSTALPSNPLTSTTFEDVPVASANAAGGQIVLSGVSGRTIYPGIPVVMVSGTAATATSLKILCSPSAKLLATLPIALLVTSVPVTPFSSTSTAAALGVPGSALGNGCVSGDSITASTVGTAMTTTTDIYVNLPFTVQ